MRNRLVERLDALHLTLGVGDVRLVGVVEIDELDIERRADLAVRIIIAIGAGVRRGIEL